MKRSARHAGDTGDSGRVARRVLESRDFAASATDEALEAVEGLCASARSHGADLSTLSEVAHRTAASEAEGVARAVSGLVGSTRDLVAKALAQGAAQHEAATRGVRAAEIIAGLASEVRAITADARLLAINANIASTRLGHSGMAAAVIATRVQGLAAEIAGEARDLADLSRELSEILPSIATRSGALREECSTFSDRASGLLAQIERSHASAGDQIAAEVVAGERRVTAVIAHATAIDRRLREHRPVEALLERASRSAASGETDAAHASLDRAVELSLASISPASEELLSLNAVSIEQSDALARLAEVFAVDPGMGGLGGASQPLRAAVDDFVGAARQLIEEQRRAVDLAVESAARRQGIGESSRRLVLEARMLTLAIRVEAGHIGATGAELVQIAAQLDTFTRRLDGSVGGADTSIRGLRALFTELLSCSRAISVLIESFARGAPHLGSELDHALERAAGDAGRALEASRERARALLAASHELIPHLQFQDRLTQEIRLLQGSLSGSSEAAPEKSFLETSDAGGMAAGDLVLF